MEVQDAHKPNFIRYTMHSACANGPSSMESNSGINDVIIACLDMPKALFDRDPHYETKEHQCDKGLASAFTKHDELAAILKQIKGKFLLFYNNDPYIHTLYRGFTIYEVEAQYAVTGAFQTVTELLIRNHN